LNNAGLRHTSAVRLQAERIFSTRTSLTLQTFSCSPLSLSLHPVVCFFCVICVPHRVLYHQLTIVIITASFKTFVFLSAREYSKG
jgi:hypothetical protein